MAEKKTSPILIQFPIMIARFLCVTKQQMLVQVFCVLLVTHGRFTHRRINMHTYIHTTISLE